MIDKKKIIVIQSYIIVEKAQYKQIILGKRGSMIKKIGLESRKDIQDFLNCKVYLGFRVKIDNQWLKQKIRLLIIQAYSYLPLKAWRTFFIKCFSTFNENLHYFVFQ